MRIDLVPNLLWVVAFSKLVGAACELWRLGRAAGREKTPSTLALQMGPTAFEPWEFTGATSRGVIQDPAGHRLTALEPCEFFSEGCLAGATFDMLQSGPQRAFEPWNFLSKVIEETIFEKRFQWGHEHLAAGQWELRHIFPCAWRHNVISFMAMGPRHLRPMEFVVGPARPRPHFGASMGAHGDGKTVELGFRRLNSAMNIHGLNGATGI